MPAFCAVFLRADPGATGDKSQWQGKACVMRSDGQLGDSALFQKSGGSDREILTMVEGSSAKNERDGSSWQSIRKGGSWKSMNPGCRLIGRS